MTQYPHDLVTDREILEQLKTIQSLCRLARNLDLAAAVFNRDPDVAANMPPGLPNNALGVYHKFVRHLKSAYTAIACDSHIRMIANDRNVCGGQAIPLKSLTNLTPVRLDLLNRFIRLSHITGLSFADLHWVLWAVGVMEGHKKIAPDNKSPAHLSRLIPLERKNEALFVNQVNALAGLLEDPAPTLSLEHLSILYRLSRLPQLTGLSIEEIFMLLSHYDPGVGKVGNDV